MLVSNCMRIVLHHRRGKQEARALREFLGPSVPFLALASNY